MGSRGLCFVATLLLAAGEFLLVAGCGEARVVGLFAGGGAQTINTNTPSPYLDTDFVFVMGTTTGVVYATNLGNFMSHAVGGGVVSVAVDRRGTIYYSANTTGNHYGVSTNFGGSWPTLYAFTGNYGSELACDDAGYAFGLQSGPSFGTWNQTGVDRMTGYQASVSFQGLGAGTINSVAVSTNGVVCAGDNNGTLVVSSNHGVSGVQRPVAAWSGQAIDHVAVSPAGIIVASVNTALRRSVDNYTAATATIDVSALAFDGERLLIGYTGGGFGFSLNYGVTITTNQGNGLPAQDVVGLGRARNGMYLVACADGTVWMNTNGGAPATYYQVHAAGVAAWDACVR